MISKIKLDKLLHLPCNKETIDMLVAENTKISAEVSKVITKRISDLTKKS